MNVNVLVFGGFRTFVTLRSSVVLEYPEFERVTCNTLPDLVQEIEI